MRCQKANTVNEKGRVGQKWCDTGDTVSDGMRKPSDQYSGVKNQDNRNFPVGTFFKWLVRHRMCREERRDLLSD
jgi:hypothetical protein